MDTMTYSYRVKNEASIEAELSEIRSLEDMIIKYSEQIGSSPEITPKKEALIKYCAELQEKMAYRTREFLDQRQIRQDAKYINRRAAGERADFFRVMEKCQE